MRITVQPVDIPELIEAMKLGVKFYKREGPFSTEDLQAEFSGKGNEKGIAKTRNIIGTLLNWGLVQRADSSRYEPTSSCKRILDLPNERVAKEIKNIILKNEPKFLEMLYRLEGSRCTIEGLSKRLGRTIVSTKVFLKWGLYFNEINKEGKFFVRQPTKDAASLPHKQLARCVASDLARIGFNIFFERGLPPVDLVAESQDKQLKIFVECKSSISEVDKGIGQLVTNAERKKNDELWLVLPDSSISKITYGHLFRILKGLRGIQVDLVFYDLKRFLYGEAAFPERIRLIGKNWNSDKIFLDKIIKADLQNIFDENVIFDYFNIDKKEAKRILNRLVYRGLLLGKNEKYSLRFKKH